MRLVVADTSPVFYLLSIGHIDLLPLLFGKVLVPDAVYRELNHPAAPAVLREWIAEYPEWLDVVSVELIDNAELQSLGAGEQAAITLALSTRADLILMDERKGTAAALRKGFEVTGTLGILRLSARRGLIDIAETVAKLKRTNFRYRPELMEDLLGRILRRCVRTAQIPFAHLCYRSGRGTRFPAVALWRTHSCVLASRTILARPYPRTS